jgi:protein-S-isoprenylcysteine O-methyltransferase Ste14
MLGYDLPIVRLGVPGLSARTPADLLLFGVTVVELSILLWTTPAFGIADGIYVSQHLLVLGIALTRAAPRAQDRSPLSSTAVVVSYGYPYAQVIYIKWVPDEPVWPTGGLVLVTLGAGLSCVSLVTLGRRFGIRPALRELVTSGPYRIVRHPIYLSYVLADIGYNLQGWNVGTALMVLAGWASLIYRIRAEERVLAQDAKWSRYATLVRSRLLPGLW